MRKTTQTVSSLLLAVCIVSIAPACDRAFNPAAPMALHGSTVSPLDAPESATVAADIEAVRASTARFHDIDQAKAAGWNTQVTDCQESAAGGQGVHWANLGLIDGAVNLLEPELIMYEPRGDGTWHLVAVEYIVPFPAWTSASAPSLFGETFHRNEAAGLWILHLWIWKPNASGLFADWNPAVRCK